MHPAVGFHTRILCFLPGWARFYADAAIEARFQKGPPLSLSVSLSLPVESDALHYGPAYDTLVQMMLTLLMETFALYQNLARCVHRKYVFVPMCNPVHLDGCVCGFFLQRMSQPGPCAIMRGN